MIESLNPNNFPKVEKAVSAVSQPKNAFDSEPCVRCASVDACAAHDDKQDAGRTDNATVLMSTDTLGQMQEDMPSFADGSTKSMTYENGQYVLRLTDTNGVLSDCSVSASDSRVQITKSGNTLTLTSKDYFDDQV